MLRRLVRTLAREVSFWPVFWLLAGIVFVWLAFVYLGNV